MTDEPAKTFDENPKDGDPKRDPSLSNTDGYIVEVTLHDKNDIVLDRSYFFLTVSDPESGEIICSNMSLPLTTDQALFSDD